MHRKREEDKKPDKARQILPDSYKEPVDREGAKNDSKREGGPGARPTPLKPVNDAIDS